MLRKRNAAAVAAALVTTGALAGSALADGFKTSDETHRQIAPVAEGVEYDPLLTVGDGYGYDFGSGLFEPDAGFPLAPYRMSGIPDGLGVAKGPDGKATVWMNHELSGDGVTAPSSRISELIVDPATRQVTAAKYIVQGDEGYSRFCSSTYFDGGPGTLGRSGHRHPAYYTGEENSTRVPAEAPPPGEDPAVEYPSGRAFTYVPEKGELFQLAALGAVAPWENVVPLADMGRFVVVGLEDGSSTGDFLTGSSNRSQLWLYVARSQKDALEGRGRVYVWVAKEDTGRAPGVPEDLAIRKGEGYTEGYFKPVPQEFMQTKDWRVNDKWVEEAGAFTFTRLEDGSQDVRRGEGNRFWFADTAEPEDDLPDDVPGYDETGAIIPPTLTPDRGRLYDMVFPEEAFNRRGKLRMRGTIPANIQVALDGDAGDNIVSPDNLDVSEKGVIFQEDRNDQFGLPGNAFPDDEGYGNVVWWPFGADEATTVARADTTIGDPGEWESSGVVRAPQFGKDTWLLDVQAHSISAPEPGLEGDDSVHVGEGGQLGLLKVPDSAGERDHRGDHGRRTHSRRRGR